jgi:hypothetical protein
MATANELSGGIILDHERRIQVLTPTAERLLGWRADAVYGQECRTVIACTDAEGTPLCERCGIINAFERREMVPAATMHMVDAAGTRHAMSTTFTYLPSTALVSEPRVMALIRRAPERPGR